MTDDDKLLASLTGFTPGPWVWGEYNNGLDGNGDVVLTYYDYEGMSCGDDANAALIAAAPDLHRIATELAAENKRLRAENSGLAQARAELGDTGGPAYPVPIDHWGPGMTLRDYFAGQALAIVMGRFDHDHEPSDEDIAMYAYFIANAMIAERGVME